jgi:hypothetical protein
VPVCIAKLQAVLSKVTAFLMRDLTMAKWRVGNTTALVMMVEVSTTRFGHC